MVTINPQKKTTPATNDEKLAEALNTLLRGELAAEEAYRLAIQKFNERSEIKILENILFTHKNHIDYITKRVFSKSELPTLTSGVWGVAVKALVKTTSLFGESPLILALREGEDYGIRDYKHFIQENNNTNIETILIIKNKIIPALENNIEMLDSLLNNKS